LLPPLVERAACGSLLLSLFCQRQIVFLFHACVIGVVYSFCGNVVANFDKADLASRSPPSFSSPFLTPGFLAPSHDQDPQLFPFGRGRNSARILLSFKTLVIISRFSLNRLGHLLKSSFFSTILAHAYLLMGVSGGLPSSDCKIRSLPR